MGQKWVLLALVCAGLSGCTQTRALQATNTNYDWSEAQKRIVLVTPDIQLGELTAGGLVEPRADWSDAARKYVAEDVAGALSPHGVDVDTIKSLASPHEVQLADLHGAVGLAILQSQIGAAHLPTKGSALDWTLGPGTREMRDRYKADYAMFVYVRDSYTSAGRALMMIGAAMLGVGIQGGRNTSFVSIVDLRTGNIVWFNLLTSTSSDLRSPDGAKAFTTDLLEGNPL